MSSLAIRPYQVVQHIVPKAGHLAQTALNHPKVTAAAIGALMSNSTTFGANALITSLPCYVACMMGFSTVPPLAAACIAACTVLP